MRYIHFILFTIGVFLTIACDNDRFLSTQNTTPSDTTRPVITLKGSNPVSITQNTAYTDAGATASDNVDGDISHKIVINNGVNTATVGSYNVTYNVSDSSNNKALQVIRKVNVVAPLDTTRPVITLKGSNPVSITQNTTYTDAGATASDNIDGNITSEIVVENGVNTAVIGSYSVTYNVSDSSNNQAVEVTRVVHVVAPTPFVCPANATTESSFNDSFASANSNDIVWSASHTDSLSVAQIAAVFNQARASDPTVSTPLQMPTQVEWDAMSDSQKALYLINSERCARGIRVYEGIDNDIVQAPASTYAAYIATHRTAYNLAPHQADGRTPWERLEQDANVDVNVNADFFRYAENIAYQELSSEAAHPTVHHIVEKSVYWWLYEDKSSSYGHRHFLLATGLVENSGRIDAEGLLALGRATERYTGVDHGNFFFVTRVYTVLNGFDPKGSWDDNLSNVIRVEIKP